MLSCCWPLLSWRSVHQYAPAGFTPHRVCILKHLVDLSAYMLSNALGCRRVRPLCAQRTGCFKQNPLICALRKGKIGSAYMRCAHREYVQRSRLTLYIKIIAYSRMLACSAPVRQAHKVLQQNSAYLRPAQWETRSAYMRHAHRECA